MTANTAESYLGLSKILPAPSVRVFKAHLHWIVPVAVVLVGTVLAWLRLPLMARGSVWAEDGALFLNSAFEGGPFTQWLVPYAGYMQLAPRMLADAAAAFGPIFAGPAINFLSCLVVGGLAGVVYACSRDVVASPYLRLVLASVAFLDPLSPIEVLANAANLHWFFLWATLWVLLYRPRSRIASGFLGVLLFVTAMSEIQVALYIPLLLLFVRDRLAWGPRIGLIAGLLWEFVTALITPRTPAGGFPGLAFLYRTFLTEAVLPTFTAVKSHLDYLLANHYLWWGTAGAALFLAAFCYVLWRGNRHQRIAVLYLVPGAFALWSAAIYVNQWPGIAGPGSFYFLRYGVVPSIFLLSALIVAAQVLLVEPRMPRRLLGSGLALAVLALMVVQFVPSVTTRSAGPEWVPAVTRAEAACQTSGDPFAAVRTAPTTIDGGQWYVNIPCSLSTHDRDRSR